VNQGHHTAVQHPDEDRRRQCAFAKKTGETWLSSAQPNLSRPRDPSSVTRRYSRLVTKLSIPTQLKDRRHYSATELLTVGVDLRTRRRSPGPRRRHDGASPLRGVGWLRPQGRGYDDRCSNAYAGMAQLAFGT
jgi:hypothetical protein